MDKKQFLDRPVLLSAIALLLFSGVALRAQQREPAVEIYGLTGAYYFGNRSHDLKGGEWNPQAGASVLFPVGSRWAVLTDGVASRLEVNEGPYGPYPHEGYAYLEFYRVNPDVRNEDVTTQRLIAILPSIIRLWRRDRFSFYLGGGLGWEHQRQLSRYRPIREHPDVREHPHAHSLLVRAEGFVDSKDSVSTTALLFRAGLLVNLTPRVSCEAGTRTLLVTWIPDLWKWGSDIVSSLGNSVIETSNKDI